MHSAELRHGVVPVLEKDPLVQVLGPLHPDVVGRAGTRGRLSELVEEQAAERLRRPRVPGEQRALDHLRQVGQGEHRPVEVGEVRREDLALRFRELLADEPDVVRGAGPGHGYGPVVVGPVVGAVVGGVVGGVVGAVVAGVVGGVVASWNER